MLTIWSVLALGSSHALVAIDLPFGSYERSPEQASDTASRIMMETGAQAVKVEAADGVADSIAFLTTVAMAFLPSYAQLGSGAAVLLALFRVDQGFALGGTWDGLPSLLSLNAPLPGEAGSR